MCKKMPNAKGASSGHQVSSCSAQVCPSLCSLWLPVKTQLWPGNSRSLWCCYFWNCSMWEKNNLRVLAHVLFLFKTGFEIEQNLARWCQSPNQRNLGHIHSEDVEEVAEMNFRIPRKRSKKPPSLIVAPNHSPRPRFLRISPTPAHQRRRCRRETCGLCCLVEITSYLFIYLFIIFFL
jgi:hypothetical protein